MRRMRRGSQSFNGGRGCTGVAWLIVGHHHLWYLLEKTVNPLLADLVFWRDNKEMNPANLCESAMNMVLSSIDTLHRSNKYLEYRCRAINHTFMGCFGMAVPTAIPCTRVTCRPRILFPHGEHKQSCDNTVQHWHKDWAACSRAYLLLSIGQM